jgi:hypothetical protein
VIAEGKCGVIAAGKCGVIVTPAKAGVQWRGSSDSKDTRPSLRRVDGRQP